VVHTEAEKVAEFNAAIEKHNVDNDAFMKKDTEFADYTTEISKDNAMDAEELGILREKVVVVADLSELVENDILNIQALVTKNKDRFQDYDATIKSFEEWEHTHDSRINSVVVYLGFVKGQIKSGDNYNYFNDMQNRLIEIRDR
jgi:hypothetical protein